MPRTDHHLIHEVTIFDFLPDLLPEDHPDICHRCHQGDTDSNPVGAAVGLPEDELAGLFVDEHTRELLVTTDDVTWVMLCALCYRALDQFPCVPLEFAMDH